MYEVYRQPLRRLHRAHYCSGATYLQLISFLLSVIVPLLIVFRAQGFWIKTNTYIEQPNVNFRHEFVIILEGSKFDSYLIWSTFPSINELAGSHQRVASLSSHEYDTNRDGQMDGVQLTLSVPLQNQEQIQSVQCLLLYQYSLQLQSRTTMQTAIVIDEQHIAPANRLSVQGDLHLDQSVPLQYAGRDNRLNKPLIDAQSLRANKLLWSEILQSYYARNVSTSLHHAHKHWTRAVTPSTNGPVPLTSNQNSLFQLSVHVRYVPQELVYATGFWEQIKWAWVQYLPVLLVLLFIRARLMEYIFKHQIVGTMPQTIILN